MKNRTAMLRMAGTIAIALVIGLLTGCLSVPPAGVGAGAGAGAESRPANSAGVGTITVTDIPSAFNGKFAMILVRIDTTNHGWGMLTISGTSASFDVLDWVTDQSTTVSAGTYFVSMYIADSMEDVIQENYLFVGGVLDKALSGQTVTMRFSEFVEVTESVSAPRIIELPLATQYTGTIQYGQTMQFRVYLMDDMFYEIEWDDNDRAHSGPLQNAADVRVGIRREGSTSYIIDITDQGNHGDSFSNTHRVHRDVNPRYETNNWHIIEVEATYAGGDFRLNVW